MRCREHLWHACSIEATPYDRRRAYAGDQVFVAKQDGYCLSCGRVRFRRLTLDGQWTLWTSARTRRHGPVGERVYSLDGYRPG